MKCHFEIKNEKAFKEIISMLKKSKDVNIEELRKELKNKSASIGFK